MGVRARLAALALVCGLVSVAASAQATGDSRTVVEPSFPATCTVLTAQQAIVNDAPADETLYDTSRIQAALTACASGQAVELAGGNGKFAFLSASLNIPTGVGLIVDGGVTLYASRKASDYQVSGSSETCGSYGSNGSACNYFFTFAKGSSNTGCGIYGYGVIDLRGGSTILDSTGADTGIKWWTNSDTATTAGKSQDNVSLMKPNKSTNLTLYKITIRNSPQFHVVTSNVNGETLWGVKIQAPFTAHNTDGVDPQGTNVTVNYSSISEGDDAIAVSGSSASSNISILNSTIYSSHGVSIGSYTQSGVSNMLVKNVNMAGEPTDGNQNGLRIKSALDRGGNVNNITYQNMCLRDIAKPILITPVYNSNSGTLYPNYTNILMQNIHVLPTTKTTKYTVSVAGIDANHLTGLTLNNVVSDQTLLYSPVFSYSTIALAGNVYPSSLQTQTGTGLTYTGSATSTATPAYDCSATATVFPFILGEMYASTATATNLQTASIASGSTVTLNAMVQPAKAQTSFSGTVGNYVGAAALTAAVNFYEGSTLVGTGTLGANSTNSSLATLTLSGVSVGTHTYTAQYPGDSNYNAIAFGNVTVTVTGATVASTTTVAVTGTLTYGATQTLTASVSPAAATGTVAFSDGSTSLGSCTLSSASCSITTVLGGGSGHSITATYGSDNTYKGSTSSAKSVTIATAASSAALSASPATVAVGSSTTLTMVVTGVSGAAAPTGTVAFTDGVTSLGNAKLDGTGTATLSVTMSALGSRTISASYPGDANYGASSATTTVQVNAAATSTALTVTPGTAAYGAAVALSATVTSANGTPTGTVNFLDGSTNVGSGTLSAGVATASVKLGGGTHSITASYAGDTAGNFAASVSSASTLTVTTAASTTAVTATPTTVTAGGTTSVSVTVTGVSGMAAPSGTVTLTDGGTNVGSITLVNGAGSATVTMATAGSRTLTATYSGDANYASSTGTAAVTVSTIATATTLRVSPSPTYPGASVTLTATVTPAVSGLTVTFSNGQATLGTATTNSSGVATYAWTAPAVGAYSLTASTAASGNYAASTSATSSLSVVTAVTVTATPNPVSIAAGSSGNVAIAFPTGSGFAGTLTASCTSPVSYVTCTPASGTVVLSGTTAGSSSVTITVAATTGMLREARGLELASLLGVLGLVGLRRRKVARVLALLVALGVFGLSGCGGGTSSGSGGSGGNKPTGSQTVTYTVVSGSVSVSTPITVNIQ